MIEKKRRGAEVMSTANLTGVVAAMYDHISRQRMPLLGKASLRSQQCAAGIPLKNYMWFK